MDVALFRLFNHALKNAFLDRWLPLLSDKDFLVIPGLTAVVLLVCLGGRRTRLITFALILAALCANFGSEKIVKNLVNRLRPYATLQGVHVYRTGGWIDYNPAWYAQDLRQSNSFPSSHAANVAALAAALAFLRRRTLLVTIPIALLAGLSRVYTGNHYPSDVLAGYVWGALCGIAIPALVLAAARRAWGETLGDMARPPLSKERRDFLWILGLWTAINFSFVCISRLCLAGDEAQYWDWSRRLALGYYSKPPLIAYLIRVLTNAGGSTEWAIRSGAVLFSSGTLALIYALTLRIAKREQTALIAVCLAIAMPATWAAAVLMTTDAPLVFFWALAMYAFHRAVRGEKAMWWLTGLALGMAMLSKYTALVLVISFALYLVLADRAPLRTAGPYLALVVMLTCQSGVLYWNAAHNWVSIHHTAGIGVQNENHLGEIAERVLTFFGGQAGVASPILLGLFGWAMIRLVKARKDVRLGRDAMFLFLCGMVLFGFYAAVAFTRSPHANWPACAYVAAPIALAWTWNERARGPGLRKLLAVAVVLGCALGILTRSTNLLYIAARPFSGPEKRPDRIHLAGLSIDPDLDPTAKLTGGRTLGATLSKYLGPDASASPFIFSNRYQLTAWAAFYTRGRPRTYYTNAEDRYNQYDLWGGWDKLIGHDGLFVTGGDEAKARFYIAVMVGQGAFERGEYLETIQVYRGKTLVKTFTISKLYKYSGLPWTHATEKF